MSFESAIEKTLEWEGGLVDDPDDPGGVTNFGISQRWLRDSGLHLYYDLKNLTKERAIEIYQRLGGEDFERRMNP